MASEAGGIGIVESGLMGVAAPAAIARRRGPSGGGVFLMAVLTGAFALAYYDRLLMVVLGQSVKHEFVLSDKELSILTGASFMILYGVTGIAFGWLADRFNRRVLFGVALTLWSGATALCGVAGGFRQMVAARCAVGASEAAMTPLALSLISDAYPIQRRPFVTSVFLAGGMIGMLAAFMLGSVIATAHGWRTTFLAAGPPGLLVALLVFLFLREPARTGHAADAPSPPASGGALRQVLANGPLVWTLGAGSICAFASLTTVQWLPAFFMRSHGMSQAQIGLFFGPVMGVGSAVGMLAGGWIGNRLAGVSTTRLLVFCAGTMALVLPLQAILLLSPSLWLALGTTFVAAALAVVYSPCYLAAVTDVCAPGVRAFTIGLSNFANNLVGGAVGPFVVGALSDWWLPTAGPASLGHALLVTVILFDGASVLLFAQAARSLARHRP